MKTNKNFSSITLFVAGLVAGLSLAGLLAFTKGPASQGDGGTVKISVVQANQYAKNYLNAAEPYNQVIRGFMVGKAQLEAMNNLMAANDGLIGFRIYMGTDQENKRRDLVVGIDRNGLDAVGSPIYNTDASGNHPCPPVCDSQSPILSN